MEVAVGAFWVHSRQLAGVCDAVECREDGYIVDEVRGTATGGCRADPTTGCAMKTCAICCGRPMIATFLFGGPDWYCMKCKRISDMNTEPQKPLTGSLARLAASGVVTFQNATAGVLVPGTYKPKCCQCWNETHIAHASVEERRRSAEVLAGLRGDEGVSGD